MTDTHQGLGAGDLLLASARIRAEAEAWNGHRPIAGELQRAEKLEGRVRQALPERIAELGAGGELVPHGSEIAAPAVFRSTLEKPDYVAASASRDRLDLLHEAGALEAALDAADTAAAQNSIEAMLVHQLAVAHRSSLKLVAQMNRQIETMKVLNDDRRAAANIEATRLAGAISRLMQTFQQGTLTLQRLRTGGRQVVTVQHVNVESGGQALVTATVSGRGGKVVDRGGGENEQ